MTRVKFQPCTAKFTHNLSVTAVAKRTARAASTILAAILLSVSACPGVLRAEGADYDVRSEAWNGLSALRQVAMALHVDLRTPGRLDVRTLDSKDAVLVIHPQVPLPRGALSEFMRLGGRVALLDDLGTGESLLNIFHIERSPAVLAKQTPRLRGQDAWPIATPNASHPLTQGIHALVTNHPQQLAHDHLEPLLVLGDAAHPLVLAGAVGEGRFVAAGDGSLLINNMLAFHDNRVFAENLLRYLVADGGGRVWLVAAQTAVSGPSAARQTPRTLAGLRKALHEIIGQPLPPTAVHITTWVIALSLLLAATHALPKASNYGQVHPPPSSPRKRSRNGLLRRAELTEPLLRYRLELRGALTQRLDLPSDASCDSVLAGLAQQDLPDETIAQARRLLTALDDLAALAARGGPTGSVALLTARRFRTLETMGRSILAALHGHSS